MCTVMTQLCMHTHMYKLFIPTYSISNERHVPYNYSSYRYLIETPVTSITAMSFFSYPSNLNQPGELSSEHLYSD